VNQLLYNPVYNALCTGDLHLSLGSDKVKYFNEAVSPFAGFHEDYVSGFSDLYDFLPVGRKIIYATPVSITTPKGWQLIHRIPGLQFVFDNKLIPKNELLKPIALQEEHVEQMMQLAKLTKPGPFGPRTIDFGYYYGIFEGGKLVAMTGQRLHVAQFTEISAVCTHPDHLGKGYAAALVQHQVALILSQEGTPFLHVRDDNERAISLYKRLGFTISRPMNFYFLKRQDSF
jgi:ribosomal protein S18 acetylase RimI-like enzyme